MATYIVTGAHVSWDGSQYNLTGGTTTSDLSNLASMEDIISFQNVVFDTVMNGEEGNIYATVTDSSQNVYSIFAASGNFPVVILSGNIGDTDSFDARVYSFGQFSVYVVPSVYSTDFSCSLSESTTNQIGYGVKNFCEIEYYPWPSFPFEEQGPFPTASGPSVVVTEYDNFEFIYAGVIDGGSNNIEFSYDDENGNRITKAYPMECTSGPGWATDFELDGYSQGDTISASTGDQIILNVLESPSGTSINDIYAESDDTNICSAWADEVDKVIYIDTYSNEGTATLTVDLTTINGNTVTKTYTVQVSGTSPSYATEVDINGYSEYDTIGLTQGYSYGMWYGYTPSESEPYSTPTVQTSDSSVADILSSNDSYFEISGVGEGSTTLTLGYTDENGNTVYKTYTIEVTSPTPIYSTDFSLTGYQSGDTLSLTEDTPLDIAVEFTPAGTTPYGLFSVSTQDPNVASAIFDGLTNTITVTPFAAGTTTLTAELELEGSSSVSYTYTVEVSEPTPRNKFLDGNAFAFLKEKIEQGGGGGGVKTLSSADYNWNYNNHSIESPNSVGLWLLEPGIYLQDDVSLNVCYNPYFPNNNEAIYLVYPEQASTNYKRLMVLQTNSADIISPGIETTSNNLVYQNVYSDRDSMLTSVRMNIFNNSAYEIPTSSTYGPAGQMISVVDHQTTPYSVRVFVCAGGSWDETLQTEVYEWYEVPVNPITPNN